MNTKIPAAATLVACFLFSSVALAEWSVVKAPLGPGFSVVHDSNSPGLVNNTRYKSKRAAKRAAKALNKAEEASADGKHEGGRGLD